VTPSPIGLDLISATDKDGNQRYYFADGLGSTTLTAEPLPGGGAETQDYKYDVFGALRSGSLQTQPYWEAEAMLFTGEQFDARARHNAGGLYYLRARFYDPEIGRFLSQDPLPGGNLYAYVGNNPVNFTDPSGLHCKAWHPHHCAKEKVIDPVVDTVSQGVNAFTTGYIDVQGSASFLMPTPFGFPIPVTVSGGVQFGLHQGPNPHLGGGIGGPPGSWGAGVNFYPDQRISEGLACGFQAGVPLRGPVGAGGEAGFGGISMHFKESLPTFDGTFYRGAGPYIGSPGAAALCSYILPTFPWW
jgi:RHS repeat-associated protein